MDRTLELLSTYACELTYEALPAAVVHQVKRTLIDTLGCAMGAFHAEPSCIARGLAESVTSRMPARLLETRHASAPDLAGFANGVMVRYPDFDVLPAMNGEDSGENPPRSLRFRFLLADRVVCFRTLFRAAPSGPPGTASRSPRPYEAL